MRKRKLNVSRYEVRGEIDLTIALVTDLHGRDPDVCLAALRAEKPDVICVAGDAFETVRPGGVRADDGDAERARGLHRLFYLLDKLALRRGTVKLGRNWINAMRFFREAAGIAPVYYAPGNHDFFLTQEDRRLIRDADVHFLWNSSLILRLQNGAVEVGGLVSTNGIAWLRKFSRKPGYKILLCHRPEFYEPHVRAHDIPLVLAGHAHGGQWRFFRLGVFSPGQGLFPKYTKGVYENRLVVSAGLANTANLPRINNPVELVVVRVTKENARRAAP